MKVKIPTAAFVKALRSLTYAASDDGHRPHLSSVWVRALAGDKVHLWATDGHWVAAIRIDDAEVETAGHAPIPKNDVARVLAAAPGGKYKMGHASLKLDGRALTVAYDVGAHITVLTHETQAPPAHTIVPRGKSPAKHERLELNLGLLRRVLNAIDALATKKGKPGIRIVNTGTTALDAAIICSPAVPEFFAMLMPMRAGGRRSMAWWFDHADAILAADKKAKEGTDAAAE